MLIQVLTLSNIIICPSSQNSSDALKEPPAWINANAHLPSADIVHRRIFLRELHELAPIMNPVISFQLLLSNSLKKAFVPINTNGESAFGRYGSEQIFLRELHELPLMMNR
jgi:hypothetical protein